MAPPVVISIVLSTDAGGFGNNATLLGSILRRTSAEVRVRVYTRGFSQKSFRSRGLSVEFIRCDEAVEGRFPPHVNEAVFDRLRIIRDFSDWDRVLVMDHDMIALCDLAEYFAEDLGDDLIAGRLFGPGNTLGRQMKRSGGLPAGWEHCSEYPYFYMAPMMNLAAMRREGIWQRLIDAHSAIGRDEQISLTAATGGRIKGIDKKWNLVPQWDGLAELAGRVPALGTATVEGIRWVNGVPEGIIHWTEAIKPWHYQSKAWRPDLWEAERTSWAQLRMGLWEKPRAMDIEPEGPGGLDALIRRGWRVEAFSRRVVPETGHGSGLVVMPHPDLNVHAWDPHGVASTFGSREPDMIRFGPDATPATCLAEAGVLPRSICVQGPRDATEMTRLRELGYVAEARIARGAWPAGGPHPKVLSYRRHPTARPVDFDEDVYLSRDPSAPPVPDEPVGKPTVTMEIEPTFGRFLQEKLPAWMPGPRRILVLGVGPVVMRLAEIYPEAAITVIEHDREKAEVWKAMASSVGTVEVLRMRLDPTIPWYDTGDVTFPRFDLLVISALCPGFTLSTRPASVALHRRLHAGGIVVVEAGDGPDGEDCLARWSEVGLSAVDDAGDGVLVLRADADPAAKPFAAAFPAGSGLRDVVEKAYVISHPEQCEDRLSLLDRNWSPMGIGYEFTEGSLADPSGIRWEEMKGMEARGKAENLRNGYIPVAVGSKRAVIRALRSFLESGAATALVAWADCQWRADAPRVIARSLEELPADWDLLYLSTAERPLHLPFSPHLIRLQGARFAQAILWHRETALRLLPGIEACDCEWDVYLQGVQCDLNVYAALPRPVYQVAARRDITGPGGSALG